MSKRGGSAWENENRVGNENTDTKRTKRRFDETNCEREVNAVLEFGSPSINERNQFSVLTNGNVEKRSKVDDTILDPAQATKIANEEIAKELDNSAENEMSPESVFNYKLQCLNVTFVEWIVRHVNENSQYVLTPVLNDYIKHLNDLKEERDKLLVNKSDDLSNTSKSSGINGIAREISNASNELKSDSNILTKSGENVNGKFENQGKSILLTDSSKSFSDKIFTFGKDVKEIACSLSENKEAKFSFNFSKSTASSTPTSYNATIAPGFFSQSSSTTPSSQITPGFFSSPSSTAPSSQIAPGFFSLPPSTTASSQITPGFFSQQPSTETTEENSDETDEPQEPTKPVTEEGAAYEKRIRLFLKADGKYVDHGIGILFVKPLENGKCQIIVRHDDALAKVMVNFLFNKSIPFQKANKKCVLVIACLAAGSSPTSMLFRASSEDDANEMMDALKKYQSD